MQQDAPRSSEPRVTAVIVTFNSAATLPVTLERVHEGRARGLLECIVVDNASEDGTKDLLAREQPLLQVIASPENLGFGRGCNLGLAKARTPYVLFLNPDAWIAAAQLEVLVSFLDSHPDAAMVGPAIKNHGYPDQREGRFPTPRRILRAALGGLVRPDIPRTIRAGEAPFEAEWVCGAVLLARREALAALGGFDPRFFLYFEETDLCYRARQQGWKVWATGTATAEHIAATSARSTQKLLYQGCIAEHYFASRFYYLCKHHGRVAATLVELSDIALMTLRNAVRRVAGKGPTDDFLVRFKVPLLKLPQAVPVAASAVRPERPGDLLS